MTQTFCLPTADTTAPTGRSISGRRRAPGRAGCWENLWRLRPLCPLPSRMRPSLPHSARNSQAPTHGPDPRSPPPPAPAPPASRPLPAGRAPWALDAGPPLDGQSPALARPPLKLLALLDRPGGLRELRGLVQLHGNHPPPSPSLSPELPAPSGRDCWGHPRGLQAASTRAGRRLAESAARPHGWHSSAPGRAGPGCRRRRGCRGCRGCRGPRQGRGRGRLRVARGRRLPQGGGREARSRAEPDGDCGRGGVGGQEGLPPSALRTPPSNQGCPGGRGWSSPVSASSAQVVDLSSTLRSKDTQATASMKRMKMVFSVGREMKQSTVLGQGQRSQRYSGFSWKPYRKYCPAMKPTSKSVLTKMMLKALGAEQRRRRCAPCAVVAHRGRVLVLLGWAGGFGGSSSRSFRFSSMRTRCSTWPR